MSYNKQLYLCFHGHTWRNFILRTSDVIKWDSLLFGKLKLLQLYRLSIPKRGYYRTDAITGHGGVNKGQYSFFIKLITNLN